MRRARGVGARREAQQQGAHRLGHELQAAHEVELLEDARALVGVTDEVCGKNTTIGTEER